MAQAPYNYVVDQPDANSYFDAVRRGRADRQAVEQDQRNNALARYLPQALQGDAGAQQQAINAGSPDQMIQLKQVFQGMDEQKLATLRRNQSEIAAMAVNATDPTSWAAVNARAKQLDPNAQEIPFEQRAMVIAKAQTVAEALKSAHDEKMLANDTSRTTAQNAASYASAAASRASAARAGMPAIDQNTGARVAPPGLQNRDSGELAKARASSDAAANIASTLMSAAPALSKINTGAGTGLARSIAGVFSATGFFPSADEFTKNYDAIEQASKTIGIDTLQKVGGSDTERELLTA